MVKFSDFFESSKGKTAMNVVLLLLVLGVLSLAIYLVIKRSSEHYAPQPKCLEALQSYKDYKCSPGATLSGFNEVELLDRVQQNCGENQVLGDYACDSNPDTMIRGGTQIQNRTPVFFPSAGWSNSVQHTNPTIWGLYSFKGQK